MTSDHLDKRFGEEELSTAECLSHSIQSSLLQIKAAAGKQRQAFAPCSRKLHVLKYTFNMSRCIQVYHAFSDLMLSFWCLPSPSGPCTCRFCRLESSVNTCYVIVLSTSPLGSVQKLLTKNRFTSSCKAFHHFDFAARTPWRNQKRKPRKQQPLLAIFSGLFEKHLYDDHAYGFQVSPSRVML